MRWRTLFPTAGPESSRSRRAPPARTMSRSSSPTTAAACRSMSAAAPSIRSSPPGGTRAVPDSAFISSTASSPTGSAGVSISIPRRGTVRASRSSCRASRRWSRRRSRHGVFGRSGDRFASKRVKPRKLVDVGELVQRGAEDLAGLADQCGAIHASAGVGERAGDTDANRGGPAEQWLVVIAGRGVALHQHLALEGVVLDRVAAGIEQVGVAADDLAVAEHNNPAALADAPVLQADVNRIQPVLHNVPVPAPIAQRKPVPFMPNRISGRNAAESPLGGASVRGVILSAPRRDKKLWANRQRRRNWPATCMVVPAPRGRCRSKGAMSNWSDSGGDAPRPWCDAYLSEVVSTCRAACWKTPVRIACALLLSASAAPSMHARDLDGRYAAQNPELHQWFEGLRSGKG